MRSQSWARCCQRHWARGVRGGVRFLVGLAALTAVTVVAPWAWSGEPSPIDPVAWSPDAVDPRFVAAPEPLVIERTLPLHGAETCAVRRDGVLACGADDGKVALVAADLSRQIGVLADTGGRPLGMRFDATGSLIVADARKGLLAISPHGVVRVLRRLRPGGDLVFPDDVAPFPGGLWLTDASTRNGFDHLAEEFTERREAGVLYRLDRRGRGAPVLAGLAFANGIAIAPSGDYLLVNETSRSRVRRLWLRGPRAGSDDVFIRGLPGNPDNISIDAAGRVWIALVTPRDPAAEALAGQPALRLKRFEALANLPSPAAAAVLRPSQVVLLDRDGKLLGYYSVPYPQLGNVTGVAPTPAGLVLSTSKGAQLGLARSPVAPP